MAAVPALVSRALSTLGLAMLAAVSASPAHAEVRLPDAARQLVVVSSPTADPPGPERIATLRSYARARPGGPWRLVLGPWPVETGGGGLLPAARRREGDRATPTGVFRFGATIYGNAPDPGGLRYRYHRLRCGDWWDENPASPRYNRFVQVPCRVTPGFAPGSEPLWTERLAYPYFIPIAFNMGPIRRGPRAPGSGIFLHSWVGAATAGCVALPRARLLRLLRWLTPGRAPEIAIGITAQIAAIRSR
ncbi:MAG TPA: L,D-transpeptidase family protein [Solirubrobacteraceae bacterium]|nr:L,D-transpeptidase family protein [Solirubrobacteraceae bacterium]